VDDQDRILAAIPEIERGVFLALALLGLRPGEARALDVSDYRDGWLVVDKGMKGASARAPIRGTKTGRPKRLPVPVPLADWIARHVSPSSRLRAAPLFVNPRTGIRWSHWAIREHWLAAAAAVGLEGVRLYEGTKHRRASPRRFRACSHAEAAHPICR
jgi:integrase